MLRFSEIGPAGVTLHCPDCRTELARVYADRTTPTVELARFPLHREIIEQAQTDYGYDAALVMMVCRACDRPLLDLTLKVIAPGEQLPQPTRVASQGGVEWIVSVEDGPQGRMETHRFAAACDDIEAWGGDAVLPLDAGSGPWDYGRHFVLNRWFGVKLPASDLVREPSAV